MYNRLFKAIDKALALFVLSVVLIILAAACSSRIDGVLDCTGSFCRQACEADEDCFTPMACTGVYCGDDGCHGTGCK